MLLFKSIIIFSELSDVSPSPKKHKRHKHKKHKKSKSHNLIGDISLDAEIMPRTSVTSEKSKAQVTRNSQEKIALTPASGSSTPPKVKKRRRRDSGTSSEEERWLDAIESGKLEEVNHCSTVLFKTILFKILVKLSSRYVKQFFSYKNM